ncbi:MAG TPA: hypothetical protein VFN23_04695 [Ktedonobacteraceae bacterium]|nr:hypothetical protein [Ktedonobacteraceae bacterium]
MSAAKNEREVWENATQQIQAVMPGRTPSIRHHTWTTIAVIGAVAVVSLYLILPMMILFGGLHDMIAEALMTLLVLTIGEFVIFRILMKTARATNLDTEKTRIVLAKPQGTDNVPFNTLVEAPTTHMPVATLDEHSKDDTQTQSTISTNQNIANSETPAIQASNPTSTDQEMPTVLVKRINRINVAPEHYKSVQADDNTQVQQDLTEVETQQVELLKH